VVVMTDLNPAHPAEKFLCTVRIDPGPVGIHLAMVDPRHVKAGVQAVPR
jgi:hypothetical protein